MGYSRVAEKRFKFSLGLGLDEKTRVPERVAVNAPATSQTVA